MMGMKGMPYWISWVVPELILGCIHACLMTGAARVMDFSLVSIPYNEYEEDFLGLALLLPPLC
jgi:hypothetical protein